MKYQKLCFVLALTLLNLTAFHYFKFYKIAVQGGDSWGYYTHLVSTFIYDDVGDYHATCSGTKSQYPNFADPYADEYGFHKHPKTGKYVVKYTNGVAMLLLPFFAAAHAYAKVSHQYTANGFTLPYLLAIGWGVIFWLSLGYYFLITVLRRYFSKYVVAVTILTLAFGSNLFYNTTYNNIMSHGLLFMAYALLIYQTDTYYNKPTQRRLILLAFAAAMIVLLRLNEIYCVLIPLLWNVTSIAALKARFQWIFTNIKQYLLASACAFLLFVPQIIYWKTVTGSFLYDGYVGEHFDFLHSRIFDGWFAYNNGWLLWSPLMVISLIGVAFVYKYAKNALLSLLILLPLHTYIIYSWWCYQYINGFGSRPMEHIYPLLAFGIASFLTFMLQRKWTTALASMLVISGIGLNLFQTWQQGQGLIFTEMTNRGAYWSMFGQTKCTKNSLIAFATSEVQPNNVTMLKQIFSTDFDDTTNIKNVMQPQNSSRMRCLTQECDTIALLNIDDKLDAYYFNVQLKNLFHADAVNGNFMSLPQLIFRSQDENGAYLCETFIRPHLLSGNTDYSIWTQGKPDICEAIAWNMKIHRRSKIKKLLICTKNPLKKPFYIDDLAISLAK